MGKSAPKAPDPVKTAAAQSGANRDTAIAQSLLNQYNTVGPDGSTTFTKNGDTQLIDSLTGKPYSVPQFTQTQTLSEANQGIYDTNKITEQNLSNIGRDQSGRIGDLLGTPLKLGNEETEARLWELGSKRLNPQFQADEQALRTRLANSGIQEGSAAFDRAYGNLTQSQNDARNSLLLSGRGQANTELMAERNAPINEITALLSGTQVSAPQFQSNPQSQVAGVDYAKMEQNKYNADSAAYQAKMGGMFGLAGQGLQLAMMSDRRLKENIRRVGTLDNGLAVYTYRMKGDEREQIGLMADEVAKVRPEAVVRHPSGFDMVRYDLAVGA